MSSRIDGRRPDELRPMVIRRGVSPYAEGSVEIRAGRTHVLVTVSVEREVPPWMGPDAGGWLTAEYGMLPRSTHTRNRREATAGKQSGRTLEIQRLIGRAVRAAVEIKKLPPVTLRFDCDVLSADGGTRTTAITGAWVALCDAVVWMKSQKLVAESFPVAQVAAISVGVVKGEPLVDLCYDEDSAADFDLNVVVDSAGRLIEVQGTAERAPVPRNVLDDLLGRAERAMDTIMAVQRQSLEGAPAVGV